MVTHVDSHTNAHMKYEANEETFRFFELLSEGRTWHPVSCPTLMD